MRKTNSTSFLIAAQLLMACKIVPKAPCDPAKAGSNPSGSLAIVNGNDTDQFPAVVWLGRINGNILAGCTGTFVGSNAILSAAHCVDTNNPTSLFMVSGPSINPGGSLDQWQCLAASSLHPNQALVMSTQAADGAAGWDAGDLSLLIFAQDAAPAQLQVVSRSAPIGAPVVLVGYGDSTTLTGAHTKPEEVSLFQKRTGTNTLAAQPSTRAPVAGVLSTYGRAAASGTGDANDSSINNGDSGGPLLVAGQVVGVAVSTAVSTDRIEAISTYVDLGSSEAHAFLKAGVANGAKLLMAP